MDLKVGDKVSFLNESGGGVIVAFRDKQTAMVSDDDGFTTPYSVKQLVKIHTPHTEEEQKTQTNAVASNTVQIALFYVPNNSDDLLGCDLDLVLLNNSGFSIYFELFTLEQNQALLFAQSQLQSGNSVLIKTIKRTELELYCKLLFQCLFNATKKMSPIQPFNYMVELKPTRFYKESNYQFSPVTMGLSYAVMMADSKKLNELQFINYGAFLSESNKQEDQKSSASKPHNYLRKEHEVDLHIDEILESKIGVNAHQMLQIQLNQFKREMDKAFAENYMSITFIHGIGNGVLKQNLTDLLKDYNGIKAYPANYKRYGNGAIKVEII